MQWPAKATYQKILFSIFNLAPRKSAEDFRGDFLSQNN